MTSNQPKSRDSRSVAAPEVILPVSYLEQAEVCREQARDAARLHRFRAALGLFHTARNLCRHACTVGDCDEATRNLANDCVRAIETEIAAYSELMKVYQRGVQRSR